MARGAYALTNKRLFGMVGWMVEQRAAHVSRETSTRDAILDAAERHFARHGFAGASMREVAAAAGLRNQASVYHYFRNKRALYEAALRRGVDGLVAIWERPAVGGEDYGIGRSVAFASTLDSLLEHLAAHPDLARLIDRAGLEEDRVLRGASAKMLRGLYASGLRALEEASTSWPREELPHVAAGLYQLTFGYFANAPLLGTVFEDDPLSPEMVARQRRFVLEAMRRVLDVDPRVNAGETRTGRTHGNE
jgi:AcrR family transcriptional regulator